MKGLRQVLILVLLASAFGLAGYWVFTKSGPFGWLMAAQARVFHGTYYPMVTGLLVVPHGIDRI